MSCIVNLKQNTDPIVEVVVYQVKPETANDKDLIVRFVNDEMKSFPGFISRKVYQSSNDSTVFTDVVTWKTKVDAEAAVRKVQQSHNCSKFLSSITKVLLFDHFNEVE
jgi:heme-degrading monooxygenase HmoA